VCTVTDGEGLVGQTAGAGWPEHHGRLKQQRHCGAQSFSSHLLEAQVLSANQRAQERGEGQDRGWK